MKSPAQETTRSVRAEVTTRASDAVRLDEGAVTQVTDQLTVEAPLQIVINGRPFMVTMRSPGDDADLVRGILFTEEVINPGSGRFPLTLGEPAGSGYPERVDVTVPEVYLCEDLYHKRALAVSASCGLCGARELKDMDDALPLPPPDEPLRAAALPLMMDVMNRQQTTFNRTGGCHAAGAFTVHGEVLRIAEDIGRHNAVDKVIGHLLNVGELDAAEVLLVSGRLSLEIMLKAYKARMRFVVAVSAPSSMAVDTGRRLGMCVIGYCRGQRATVYTHEDRVRAD